MATLVVDPVMSVRVITEPSVYLIGKQELQAAELDRFLTDHGVSWQTDSEVAAEVVTETAGRVCYMSFAKPRPGGNATYGHRSSSRKNTNRGVPALQVPSSKLNVEVIELI